MVKNGLLSPALSSKGGGGVRAGRGRCLPCLLSFGLWLLAVGSAAASTPTPLQFDVFLGYDGVVPEASWFPVVCEIKNEGPSFTGTIELTSDNQAQTRRLMVELPTGTLKRVVRPGASTG